MGYERCEVFSMLLEKANRVRKDCLSDKGTYKRQLVTGNVLLSEIGSSRADPEQDYAAGFPHDLHRYRQLGSHGIDHDIGPQAVGEISYGADRILLSRIDRVCGAHLRGQRGALF